MRALIQRVSEASVTVSGEIIASISEGLCVFIGISKYDTNEDMKYIANKIVNLRLFNGPNDKKWDKCIKDKFYQVLCISQFTLQSTLKGAKPDFRAAMSSEEAKEMYELMINEVGRLYDVDKVKSGKFQAFQSIKLINEGPVTIMLDSADKKFHLNLQNQTVKGKSENVDNTQNLP